MAEPLRGRGPRSRGGRGARRARGARGRCPRARQSPARLIPDTVLVDLVSDSDEEVLEVADPVEVPVARLPAPAKPEQDSDSDSEGAAEGPAGAPRTLVRRRRRRLLDPGEAPVVPVYSGKVQSSLNLIPDNSSLLKLCPSEPEDEADLTNSGSSPSEDDALPSGSPWRKKLRKKCEKEEKKMEEFPDQDISPLPQPSSRNKSRKHTEALQKLREVNKRLQDLRSCLSPKQHQSPALQSTDDEVVLVEGPVLPQSSRLFTLKIRCRADLVRLPVRMDSPLKVLMSHYEEAMGLSGHKLSFFFDGTKLSGKELPADLGLESGDLIEVWG
ncbi:NFATC2-interacting protein isoform 2 [Mus musculus]|uniref:NFATC2-interacting protein isoform 2 n=1 Tax=Mus musculus TaxID=10090 RepID=UPI0003D78B5B|nr:NFATC2-interacting protein isoform 2 [Mus musculus]|eukprot:XP_006507493.1 PREDICTED: NFATC2-interacting protein isoform X1 [Mus musculus]